VILGVDPGQRRVGLALADPAAGVAVPLEVVDTRARDPVERIAELVADRGVSTVVVGRPVTLDGSAGPAVSGQRGFVARLRARLEVEVEEFDERLTSVAAERSLRAGGLKRGARRAVVDAVAAQVMLQGYLDRTRA
jgi:putative Holliday junction resolvase